MTVDGVFHGRVVADEYREDLQRAGLGEGRHAFTYPFDRALAEGAHTMTLTRESDGAALPDSPVRLLPGGAVLRGSGAGQLVGHIDAATRERISGWAYSPSWPDEPVSLVVEVDGREWCRVMANERRPDLATAGYGDGRRAFNVAFEPKLSPLRHVLTIRREQDGAPLPGSPVMLDDPAQFDESVQAGIAAVLDSGETDADMRARITFLAEQLGRLLQVRSDRVARRGERISARQIRRRWAGEATPEPAVLGKRALILDLTMPQLGRDAGSAAIVSHARSLQRLGYEVVLAPADMGGEGAEALEALGIATCCSPWFGSIEEVLRAQSGCFDLVYLHRVECAFPYMALVRRHNPRARVVFSVADLQHVRLARQAGVEDRAELLAYSRQVGLREFWAAREADAVITHSSVEAAVLGGEMTQARVHTIPWSVRARPSGAGFDERAGLAFVGGYGHPPNVDAALWLLDDVLPLLGDPGIECLLVGSAMPEILRRSRKGVVAVGQVDDLQTVFDRVRLTVAPLLYGAGLKGKVIESLAAGVPCVCTPVAAEGVGLGPALSSLVAADAPGLAASIRRLHGDAGLWAECRGEALALIESRYSEGRVDALLGQAVS